MLWKLSQSYWGKVKGKAVIASAKIFLVLLE